MIAGHQTMNYYLPVKSVYFLMGMFKQAPAWDIHFANIWKLILIYSLSKKNFPPEGAIQI